jgi:hypothetical protein
MGQYNTLSKHACEASIVSPMDGHFPRVCADCKDDSRQGDYRLFFFYLAGPSQGSVSNALQIAVMLERAIEALWERVEWC